MLTRRQNQEEHMIRRIVLAFAVLAGLGGAALATAGVTATPAAACGLHRTS